MDCDLLVVGAGINGAGIARDAAGRGLSVVVCDKGDLGGGTSSASGKLIHGGLRYLEHLEFRLVREALTERETLMGIAPHITRPMRFVLPHDIERRPFWFVRLGLMLYDHLGRRKSLPGTEVIRLDRSPAGATLRRRNDRAFVYSDVWVDDARLVVLNCIDAAERGATVLPRTACVAAHAEDGHWIATLEAEGGMRHAVRARAVVNAAGPWVDEVLRGAIRANADRRVRLVKGSHVVLRKWYAGDHAYVLQNDDRRLLFVVPFEDDFVVVGTTDIPFTDRAEAVAIDDAEIAYLLGALNRRFALSLTAADLVWRFSGVRPLLDDGQANPSAVTRDYAFDLQRRDGGPPLLSIFGGKITTYRRLAEHALRELGPLLGSTAAPWTAGGVLPGGDGGVAAAEDFAESLRRDFPWLPPALARRYARTYGSRARRLIGDARRTDDLGRDFGAGLHERELVHLRDGEWARCADDAIWRRTKLGLHLAPPQVAAIARWFDAGDAARKAAAR
ncbi:MAG: glycerol-3-phosphate dehydrogenase [Alphaproteobacteria bacterium]|nr:glycerol-3-phosphate dehydrogenase [Alphaproteobacteria bacterium]